MALVSTEQTRVDVLCESRQKASRTVLVQTKWKNANENPVMGIDGIDKVSVLSTRVLLLHVPFQVC